MTTIATMTREQLIRELSELQPTRPAISPRMPLGLLRDLLRKARENTPAGYLRARLDSEDESKSQDALATACAIFKSHAIDALAEGTSLTTLHVALDELAENIEAGFIVLSSRSETD